MGHIICIQTAHELMDKMSLARRRRNFRLHFFFAILCLIVFGDWGQRANMKNFGEIDAGFVEVVHEYVDTQTGAIESLSMGKNRKKENK